MQILMAIFIFSSYVLKHSENIKSRRSDSIHSNVTHSLFNPASYKFSKNKEEVEENESENEGISLSDKEKFASCNNNNSDDIDDEISVLSS